MPKNEMSIIKGGVPALGYTDNMVYYSALLHGNLQQSKMKWVEADFPIPSLMLN
jgi:hypothetical protein